MKRISFEPIKKEPLPDHEYEYLVQETAKLIGRPYIQTHKIVCRWPLTKIRNRLNEAQKHHGDIPKDVYWWWLRKTKG